MTDVLTPEQRRKCMASIRNKDTKPETIVRKLVHAMGYRYRLHRKELPGKPDLVFSRMRKVIFVHGCFWHMHRCRYGRVKPKTNAQFWADKRESNRVRDMKSSLLLNKMGWDSLILWECNIMDKRKRQLLESRLVSFLQDT